MSYEFRGKIKILSNLVLLCLIKKNIFKKNFISFADTTLMKKIKNKSNVEKLKAVKYKV